MENNIYHIENLKINFEKYSSFSLGDISFFYKKYNQDISQSAIRTRISRLVEKGIIQRIGRGKYKIGNEKLFTPIIDAKQKHIYKTIYTQFPDLRFSIWHTSLFSEFMVHQPAVYYTIIETESDKDNRTLYSQSVFDFLKEHNNEIFHNPNVEIIKNYVSESNKSIIVMPMISEAPLQIIDNILTVTLEKILVDIYCNKELFSAQQGSEKAHIFSDAFSKYTVNTSQLLRYAARRGKKQQINEFINLLKIS